MANDEEITMRAVRTHWPIIIVAVLGIVAWTESRMTVNIHGEKISQIDRILNRKAFTDHAVWKTNVERDIEALQKGCR